MISMSFSTHFIKYAIDNEIEVYQILDGKYSFTVTIVGPQYILPNLGCVLSNAPRKPKTFIYDILSSLAVLNNCGYAHCDLSYENILYDGHHYHLIDMEHCRKLNSEVLPTSRPYKDRLRPHELYESTAVITELIDIWVLGRIFVLWINGLILEDLHNVPFKNLIEKTLEILPENWRPIISTMFSPKVTVRMSATEILRKLR